MTIAEQLLIERDDLRREVQRLSSALERCEAALREITSYTPANTVQPVQIARHALSGLLCGRCIMEHIEHCGEYHAFKCVPIDHG